MPTAPVGLDPLVLRALADLSQALAVSVDIERTLKQAVNSIARCMAVEAASVFLLDRVQGQLVCRACAGPVDLLGLRLPLGEGVVGRALQTDALQMVLDAQNDPDFAGKVDAKSGFTTHSLLCAPLSTADGPIGVIEVLNKREGKLFKASDGDVLRALAAPTALAISHAALAQERMDQTRIQRELKLARQVQRALLPKPRVAPYPVWGVNRPARETSGDFFDFFELPDGRVGFTIGDVSGKGLDASLLMVRAASLLRWAGKEGAAPEQWLVRANRELCDTVTRGMFVCAVAGYWDPASCVATWANAGFLPALLRRAADGYQQWPSSGPPLGILREVCYIPQRALLRGASLYFFSDGASDARDAQGRCLGLEGVRDLVSRYADLPAPERLPAIIRHLRRQRLPDDTTLLLIEGCAP